MRVNNASEGKERRKYIPQESPHALVDLWSAIVTKKLPNCAIKKNRQSRTTCSYFCSREIKNRNGLAFNPDKTEEDHLCSCFQSITLPGID